MKVDRDILEKKLLFTGFEGVEFWNLTKNYLKENICANG